MIVLVGALGTHCMMTILMNNVGVVWDIGKKLYEKLTIKTIVQGKVCVVGDTVGNV